MAYPHLDEAWSANIIVGLINFGACVFLFVPPVVLVGAGNFIFASCCTVVFAVTLLFVKEDYNRE